MLHSHHEIEISFKFIPKILMSKECIHFFGPLCIRPSTQNNTYDAEDDFEMLKSHDEALTFERNCGISEAKRRRRS